MSGADWVVAIFCACLLALLVYVVSPWLSNRGSDRLVRSQMRTRVLVTMLDGTAFRGALDASDGHSLVLLDAEMLAAGGERAAKANGRMILPRNQVSYIQVI